jgi:hypothetical protein
MPKQKEYVGSHGLSEENDKALTKLQQLVPQIRRTGIYKTHLASSRRYVRGIRTEIFNARIGYFINRLRESGLDI